LRSEERVNSGGSGTYGLQYIRDVGLRFYITWRHCAHLPSYSTSPVSNGMGDRLPVNYLRSDPGQLSLAIPSWVAAMSRA